MQSFKMFITSLWGTLYQLCGEDDYVIGVYGEVTEVGGGLHRDCIFVGSLVLTTSVYVFVNLFYFIMDLTGRPAFLYKYKIQGEQHV